MSTDSTCKECSLSVEESDESYIICDGYCAGFFHNKCAGLSEAEVDVLNANIIWLCDECVGKFMRARGVKDDTTAEPDANIETCKTTVEDEIQSLRDEVAAIRNTMSTLLPTSSTDTIETPVLHSTPVASFELHDGTSMCGNIIVDTDQASPQQSVKESIDGKTFSLLLTNIDASVSVWDIRRMVDTALGTHDPEYIEIVKLVPYWKRRDTVDFISFKVVLDGRWRSKAMDPSTWPKGVKYREFIKRRIDTWKPV